MFFLRKVIFGTFLQFQSLKNTKRNYSFFQTLIGYKITIANCMLFKDRFTVYIKVPPFLPKKQCIGIHIKKNVERKPLLLP